MSQPTPTDVHLDAALTDFSVAILQRPSNFIADRVFPIKPVDKKTDKYHIFTRNDFLRDDAVHKRAPGEPAPRSGFTLSNDSYDASAYWTEVPLSDMVQANADAAVPMDRAATQLVTHRMLIRRERLFATAYMNTDSVWDTDVTGGTDFTQWDDSASDPEQNVQTGKETVLKNTGLEPNVMVVSYQTHLALKRHPLIKDRFKYTSSESITEQMIARFFELDDYVVARGVYATNNEGGAASNSFAIGKHAVLLHRDNNASVMSPTAGSIFAWSGLTGANGIGVQVESYFDQRTKDDIVRGNFAFDMKVTGSALGYRFKSAVS